MKIERWFDVSRVPRALLASASRLVPSGQRAEWMAEWQAELFYVLQADRNRVGREAGQKKAIAFCLGAFSDAFWLRSNAPFFGARQLVRWNSARRCLASLALVAASSLILALLLPGARRATLFSPYPGAAEIVTISRGGYTSTVSPTITVAEYEAWKHRRQSLFSEIAFYSPVRLIGGKRTAFSVAIASDNLFQLLRIPLSVAALNQARATNKPAVVLSDLARKRFVAEGDPVGRLLKIGEEEGVVVGVIPGSLSLPGNVAAWLLTSERALTAFQPNTAGFVFGRTNAARSDTRGRWHLSVPVDDGYEDFDCVPLSERIQLPFQLFLWTLLLACLALPATTPLSLGDYPATSGAVLRPTRRRRWAFLSAKMVLILPIVYCCSLCLAYVNPALSAQSSEYIQIVTSFTGCLFAFRWALRDQRQRCPVCLGLLSNPVRVGEPSRNFLAWNGTELMCASGHGLLHVPEIATSWFATQRWLNLDPSWRELFEEAYLPQAPGMV